MGPLPNLSLAMMSSKLEVEVAVVAVVVVMGDTAQPWERSGEGVSMPGFSWVLGSTGSGGKSSSDKGRTAREKTVLCLNNL